MTTRRELEDFNRQAGNFRQSCQAQGNIAREAGLKALAGALYVLAETVYRDAQDVAISWGGMLEPEEPPTPIGKRKPAAAETRCRHDWLEPATPDAPVVCAKCGHRKGKQGRKPAAPDAVARTVPLPLPPVDERPPGWRPPMGEEAADRFVAGGVGGPGGKARR